MAQCFKKKPWKFQSDWTAKVFEQLKASSGWLEKWKATYGIVNSLVEGESDEVQEPTIESWMERLREICIG